MKVKPPNKVDRIIHANQYLLSVANSAQSFPFGAYVGLVLSPLIKLYLNKLRESDNL